LSVCKKKERFKHSLIFVVKKVTGYSEAFSQFTLPRCTSILLLKIQLSKPSILTNSTD